MINKYKIPTQKQLQSMNQQEFLLHTTKLLAEAKRLREQNKLMVDYFRFMRDGGFTDADWITVNEWIGEEEE